ncbi:MAG: MBL fold metallo-hydrolase [Gemmatimonadota bacterium]
MSLRMPTPPRVFRVHGLCGRGARSGLGALTLAAAFLAALPGRTTAQDWDAVTVKTQEVADGVYMLVGRGGNIGLSVGGDGVFVIDDQFAPLTPKILAAIREISGEPVRFVFNTHWHGDHTGGNEEMGKAGALLVAHDNVRVRLSMDQVLERVGRPPTDVPAAPEDALPVVTFTEDITFHLNGDDLHAFHVAHAHTDGDAIIHFRRANVVHMGDTFFHGRFPFIDTASGGSIDGLIAAVGRALAVMDADTRVIPGHGPLATRADLRGYADALKGMRKAVRRAMDRGMSLAEIQEARPIARWAAAWGQDREAEDNFVATLYSSLGGR